MRFTHESVLKKEGYRPRKFIGMLQDMFLYCSLCGVRHWHHLVARSSNDYKYVCNECHCVSEYEAATL